MLKIYTDGACSGNPGPGGYGIAVFDDDSLIAVYGESAKDTTNNRMELEALIGALHLFCPPDIGATIYSDSSYVVNTYNTWMHSWQANGWIKSDKKVPENLELIKELYDLSKKHRLVQLEKIKGHCRIAGNEIADALATGRISSISEANKLLEVLNGR